MVPLRGTVLPSRFSRARRSARTSGSVGWSLGTVLGLAAAGCADRDGDADQRNDRTDDGPGGGVAHRATADDAEALQSPQQTEQRYDHTNHYESNAHAF